MVVEKVVKNVSWLTITEIISQIFGFLLVILMARYLSAEGLGKFTLAFTIAETVFILADLGISSWFIREVSRDKSKAYIYLSNINSMRGIVGLFCIILVIIISLFMGLSAEKIIIGSLAAVSMLFALMATGVRCVFNAYEQMEYMGIEKLIKTGSNLLLGYIIFKSGFGIIGFTVTVLGSYILAFIFNLIISHPKLVKFHFRCDFNLWKDIFKVGLPFWIQAAVLQLHLRIGILILSFLKGDVPTGIYTVANQLVQSLYFIPVNIVVAAFPLMSRFFAEGKESLRLVFTKIFQYLFTIIFPIAVGTSLLAPRIIEFFYKSDFSASAQVLQVLIWSQVFLFLNYLLSYYLISANRQKIIVVSTIVSTLCNVIFNFLLVPSLGPSGTAISAILSGMVDFGIMYGVIPASYRNSAFLSILKPILAGILMGVFVFVLKDYHILIIVPSAAIAYFALVILLGSIGKTEWNLVKMIWKKS